MNRKTEKAYVLDKNGKTVFSKAGGKDVVGFTESEVKYLKDNIMIHNHPSGYSFSVSDVTTMLRAKAYEIRVVGKKSRYIMKLKDPGKYLNSSKLEEMTQIVTHDIYSNWKIPLDKGYLTAKEASRGFHNELWEEVTKKFDGLIYEGITIP